MRIAVVGAAGKMGRHHARLLSAHHEVVEVEIGQSVAAAALDCDAAVIASPTALHYSHACEFIRKGVPVLIEKPITLAIAEAESLVSLAVLHHTPVAVGYLERFNPAVMEVEADLFAANTFTMIRFGPIVSDVYGSAATDLATHELDLLGMILGPNLPITLDLRSAANLCSFTLPNLWHNPGMVLAGRCGPPHPRKWFLEGDSDIITVDLAAQTVNRNGVLVSIQTVNKLQQQLVAFFDFIAGKPSRIATAADGLAALRLAAGSGQP